LTRAHRHRRRVDLHQTAVVNDADLDGAVGQLHLAITRIVVGDAYLDVPAHSNGGVAVQLQLGARGLTSRDVVARKQRRVSDRRGLRVTIAALNDG
jgi:hypothetical protein